MTLVTLLIPAFDEIALLRRGLQSIIMQTHRPLEVIIADDCSPQSLEYVAQEFSKYDGVSLIYIRNKRNLRLYWNIMNARRYATGKYMIYFQHDDYLISENFIREAVATLESFPECNLYVSNSIEELSGLSCFNIKGQGDLVIDGNRFLKNDLWTTIHPSYSSVLFDNQYVISKGYDDWAYPETTYELFKLLPDEYFFSLVLAAEDSEVFVSNAITSVRGFSPRSLSRSECWKKNASYNCFISSVKIFDYFRLNKKYCEVVAFARHAIVRYSMPSINFNIFRLLGFRFDIIVLVILSVMNYHVWSAARKLRSFFKDILPL